eukprot:GHUV01006344.1.p1 GENE.GHUV01006344.1~~GHUV01006344.1.p1  ORF type:complete len:330 (+),score=58.57 GHUV01006344.1:603-1592(+)
MHCPYSRCTNLRVQQRPRSSLRSCVVTKAAASAVYNNPVGVHALVFAGDWSEGSAVAAASGAAKAGYDLVEIPAFNADKLGVAMTKRVFSEHGVKAACSLGLSLDADISSDDDTVVQQGAACLDNALAFAAGIGAQHLCGILYSALAKYPRPPTAAGRRNAIRELKVLADKAADRGVKVCLEVVNRYETNLLNTAAQAMDLIAEANHPNMYVHLDSYHMNIEEPSMEMAVRLCGDRLGYVHLGESHRGYMGSGSVDFEGLFRGLADIRYEGPITFESFSSAVVSEDLSNNLCVWRNLWSDSADLAAHARGYVDTHWRAALITAHQARSS